MRDLRLTRREFVKGCGGAAIVGATGGSLMFADPVDAAVNSYDTVVHLFLRGGLDGLNLVVPTAGADRGFYEEARPSLQIATSGAYGALPLLLANGTDTGFGLHPSATGLRDLWNDGRLAIVHACGMATPVTRSPFDAQLYIDLGTPGKYGPPTGWMTRAWETRPGGTGTLPALGVSGTQPAGLMGAVDALTMSSPSDFSLNTTAWSWQRTRADSPAGLRGVAETVASLWNGQTGMEITGRRADGALRLIEEGVLATKNVDHFLCHYSSHHFRGKIADLLEMSGASIPQEKWFTNLYTRGNTGAASILIMLDEFLREVHPAAGARILCMVPESGRFNTAYMHLTVVEA